MKHVINFLLYCTIFKANKKDLQLVGLKYALPKGHQLLMVMSNTGFEPVLSRL